jgi:hypothetical protein
MGTEGRRHFESKDDLFVEAVARAAPLIDNCPGCRHLLAGITSGFARDSGPTGSWKGGSFPLFQSRLRHRGFRLVGERRTFQNYCQSDPQV